MKNIRKCNFEKDRDLISKTSFGLFSRSDVLLEQAALIGNLKGSDIIFSKTSEDGKIIEQLFTVSKVQ